MTYQEVWAEFEEYVLPMIKEDYEQDGQPDIPARCEAFNNFTDMLCKDGRITDEQYNQIEHPLCNEYPEDR